MVYNISKEQDKYDQIVENQFKWASKKDIIKNPARKVRYERVYSLIRKIAKTHKKLKILDIACGNGDTTYRIAKMFPYAEVEGVDISRLAIDYAKKYNFRKNINYLCRGIEDLEYLQQRKSYFNVVLFNGAIEHVKDDLAALEYIYNMCSNVSDVIILTTAYKKYWSMIDTLAGHYRRYDPNDFRKLVAQTKFSFKKEIITGFPFSLIIYLIQSFKTEGTDSIYRPKGIKKNIYLVLYPLIYILMKIDRLFEFTKKGHLLIVWLQKR